MMQRTEFFGIIIVKLYPLFMEEIRQQVFTFLLVFFFLAFQDGQNLCLGLCGGCKINP